MSWCLSRDRHREPSGPSIHYAFAFAGGLGYLNVHYPSSHRGAALSTLYLIAYAGQVTMNQQRNAVAEYLRARRALVQPEDVGLARAPGRRVEGLRRQEVATLARISPEYYVRLERGHDHQPSDQVLLALAQALRLDDAATAYLLKLNHTGMQATPSGRRPSRGITSATRSILALLTDVPAIVIDSNQDVLAGNALAKALGPGYLEEGANLLLATFDPGARRMGTGWREVAERVAGSFRLRSNPDDPRAREILADLLIHDPDFPDIWARHDVQDPSFGSSAHFIEPFGFVDVAWQHLHVPATDQVVVIFANPPGSKAAAVLRYLAELLPER